MGWILTIRRNGIGHCELSKTAPPVKREKVRIVIIVRPALAIIMRRAADRAIERIVDLLTPEQKAKWHELVGDPFLHDLPPVRS